MSPPGGGVIAAQLLELGKNNEIVSDQVLRQELALAMPRIYSILTGMIASDEIEIVKAVLEGCRWIWGGIIVWAMGRSNDSHISCGQFFGRREVLYAAYSWMYFG